MFVLEPSLDVSSLHYTIMQNNGGSSSQWLREKTISLASGSWYLHEGSGERCLFLRHLGPTHCRCFRLDIDTFQLEIPSALWPCRVYSNFPPALLSSPTVSSGVEKGAENEMLEQGCVASSSAVTTVRNSAAVNADGQAED